jgi:histidyl-tRNA synthetase
MTPTLARMIIKRAGTLRRPIKWYSISRCCRYERPQRGRFREFFQWNIDLLGVQEPTADAEVIATAVASLVKMGLGPKDFEVRIGSRDLLGALLSELGIPRERHVDLYTTIDRMTKLPPDKGRKLLSAPSLPPESEQRILAAVAARGLDEVRALVRSDRLLLKPLREVEDLFSHLGASGMADFCALDLGIVRGLAYYTGIVFEIFAKGEKLRAIAGGGRYDGLISSFGGEAMPAVGFGLGDAVIQELLAEKGLLPSFKRSLDFFVVPLSKTELPIAIRIAHALRAKGRSAEYSLQEGSMRKLMRDAGNSGAACAVIVGPDEVREGALTLRHMASGEQRKIPLQAALAGDIQP